MTSSAQAAPSLLSRPLAIWLLIALTYAIAFLQRVAPQTYADVVAQDFGLNATGVGLLASAYFYGYTAMQMPAGIFVDVFGVRKVMILSLVCAIAGTIAFAFAPTSGVAFMARVLIACGDALVFTVLIKYVVQNFSATRLGAMTGLSQVSGYLGGILATAPLAAAISGFGWRSTFQCLSLIMAVNLVLLFFFLRDPAAAAGQPNSAAAPSFGARLRATLDRLKVACRSRASWGCALTFSSHFVVVTTLTGVWGIPMLMHVDGFSRVDASYPVMAFMIATIAGSLLIGFWADKWRSLFNLLMILCGVRIATLLLMIPGLGFPRSLLWTSVLFGVLGLVSGGVVPIVVKCLRKLYSAQHIGLGGAFNTTLANALMAIAQPLIGLLMELMWRDTYTGVAKLYPVASYVYLLGLLLMFGALGILGPLMMRREIDAEETAK